MSLENKWKDYRAILQLRSDEQERLLREAFYAGAEAVLPVAAYNTDLAVEYQAEIDHFRSHK